MQVCTAASGNTDSIACGKPFSPSTTAIRISFVPRDLSSFITPSQNLAPSYREIHIPRICLRPAQVTPIARCTALFRTSPSSRILTRSASKYTMAYTSSSGRDCHSLISSCTESVTFEISSADTDTP